jgi:hypothetical protein
MTCSSCFALPLLQGPLARPGSPMFWAGFSDAHVLSEHRFVQGLVYFENAIGREPAQNSCCLSGLGGNWC